MEKDGNVIVCHRYGDRHIVSTCKFKTVVCYSCGKVGHLTRMCWSKAADNCKQRRGNPLQQAESIGIHQIPERVPEPFVDDYSESDGGEERAYTLSALRSSPGGPLKIEVCR